MQFTLGCDDVCAPCKHKSGSGLCTDAVTNLQGYTEKDAYNKTIDARLAQLLALDFAKTYTSKEYCALLYARKEVIFEAWTLEPQEQTQRRYDLFCKGCARYLGL